MFDQNILEDLCAALTEPQPLLKKKQVLVGFDGYIDKLVHLKRNQNQPPEYFKTIGEFSGHIASNSNQSCDIEVDCISEKLGGNGPLLAQALAAKGVQATCIGAFGYPKLHKSFDSFAKNCKAISVEQPANTFAMEFSDGKLMFGDSDSLAHIDFAKICDRVGLNELEQLLNQCDLFCFTNWSGLLYSNNLLEGISTKVCSKLSKKERMAFFDLADPSPKSPKEFQQFFKLLRKFQEYFWTIIGLNPKECLLVYNQFFQKKEPCFTPKMLEELRLLFPVHEIAFHGIDYAMAGTQSIAMQTVRGERVQSPKVVTGGGDNFNSGYCIGKLMGLSPALCACLGNFSSMLFVANGESPDLSLILNFIKATLL
jgi:hypothetical protein